MSVKPSPRGNFYIASHGRFTVFHRDREVAMSQLLQLIWPVLTETA